MTRSDKYALCLKAAQCIVRSYRQAAPAGVDPQNSVAVCAVAGTVVAAGVSAYSASQSGGGDTPSAPKFHKAVYTPLDPDSLGYTSPDAANALATQFDKQGYAAADADFKARHPDLVRANRINERSALDAVSGELPAGLQAEFMRAGLSGPAASFGSIVPGSIGQFGVARNLGQSFLEYRQRAADNLARLNATTPERQFGIGGAGALQIALGNQATRNSVLEGNNQGLNQVAMSNATGQNASDQAGFAGALQAYAQQQAATNAAINSGIAGLSSAAKLYGSYGTTAGGGGGLTTIGSVGYAPGTTVSSGLAGSGI